MKKELFKEETLMGCENSRGLWSQADQGLTSKLCDLGQGNGFSEPYPLGL